MKRKGTTIIGVLVLLGLILYLSGGSLPHHSSRKNRDAISKNVAALSAQASADMPALGTSGLVASEAADIDLDQEQEKIVSEKDADFDNAKLTSRFLSCMIVGDSIADAGREYGWLTESNYSSKVGISISSGSDQIDAAISAAPEVMFLSFGVNDIEEYNSDVASFISDYRGVIERVQKEDPSTRIYVCALFAPTDSVAEAHSFYQYLDTYNQKLEALCEETNVHYVDCNFLLEQMPELYDADGIHPISSFYPLWYTYLADIAGLPES